MPLVTEPSTAAEVVFLDGGTGTELQRAGMSVRGPWWTARALLTEANRALLRATHSAYVRAGAQVITANTLRCNLRTLRRTRLDGAGREWMVHAAVGVAEACRDHLGAREVRIAGSVGPVEDCYHPDAVPSDDELRTEHRWLIRRLVDCGVDLILIETMNTVREARIATELALAENVPVWVAFVGAPEARILSGTKIADAARAVGDAEAVLVNCSSRADTESCLGDLREVRSGPIGAYPNVEDRSGLAPGKHVDRYLAPSLGPEEFAELGASWRERFGVNVLGGCCGTTPAHVAALNPSWPKSA